MFVVMTDLTHDIGEETFQLVLLLGAVSLTFIPSTRPPLVFHGRCDREFFCRVGRLDLGGNWTVGKPGHNRYGAHLTLIRRAGEE